MCWRVENMWSTRHYQLRSAQTMETQYWMQSALKSLHTGRESPADEWEVTLSRMITGVQWYSYCRISTINRVPNEPSLHPPIDYHWLLLLNVSMIQLVILLIMISSGYYSTILLIIWQLHWLSTHPPTTPLQSTGPNIKIPHNPLITDRRSLSLFFVWFSCQKWLSGNCLTCGFMLKPWLNLHVHGNLENLAGGLNLAITESEYLSWLV